MAISAPHIGRPRRYEGEELIAWILDEERLRAMFPWWDGFVDEQEQYREIYRCRAIATQFTKQLTMTKEHFGIHWFRIPVKIDEIITKIDPDLDGRNEKKMNAFLKDYPVFDLRMRGV